MASLLRKLGTGAPLLLLSSAALAHPGHETAGLLAGLAHPFGADHLLAMVAVGVWSVAALPAERRWAGPATFLLAMALGAGLGLAGVGLPGLELGVAASVLLLGLMLAFAAHIAPAAGLALVAAAALLHGLAHGAEAPAAAVSYALGFLATTAALHGAGLAAALALRRRLAVRAQGALTAAGLAFGAAGAYLLAQV